MPQLLNESNDIRSLIALGRQAQGHNAGGTGIGSAPPVVAGTIKLARAMPAFGDEAANYERRFTQRPAGGVYDLIGAIRAASVVCSLGAQIVPLKSDPHTVTDSQGTAATYIRKAEFKVIESAAFQVIAESADITATSLPFRSSKIDNLGDVPTHGARFVLERADQREFRDSELEAIISHAVALGLGQIADRVLLGKINAAAPAVFSVGALAAKGLRATEIKALVGTAGTGAGYVQGSLFVSGVEALLTREMTQTIIGAWPRAAIAMEDEVQIIVNRMNVAGRLEVSVFTAVDALVPDTGAFFRVE